MLISCKQTVLYFHVQTNCVDRYIHLYTSCFNINLHVHVYTNYVRAISLKFLKGGGGGDKNFWIPSTEQKLKNIPPPSIFHTTNDFCYI